MDQVLPEELDFAAAQAALQRRRLVAQQLAQQAATPMQGQMVSGHYIAPGKLNVLAQLLSGLAAGKMEKDLDAKEQDLAGRRRAALEKGLAQYMDLRNGTPDQPMGPPTEEGKFGVQPGKKADPRAAAIRAVTSSMPELRQLGMLDLQGLVKQEQETFGQPVTERDPATGKLVSVRYGNRGSRQLVQGAVPFEKPMAVGERVVDPANPGVPLADFSPKFGPLQELGRGPDGKPIIGQTEQRSGKNAYPPQGTQVNVDTQGNKEALSQQGAVLKEARLQAIAAKDTRSTAARVMQALDDPAVITGFAANAATGVSALAKKLGWDDKQAVGKTQALAADLAKNVLNNAAALKPLSDSDIKFLKDVTGGNIAVDRETLRQLAGIAYAASHNALIDSYEQYNSAATVKGGDEIVKLYPWPGFGTSKTPDKLFREVEGGRGRVQWEGRLFNPNPQGGAGGAPKRMTLEEYRQYLQTQGR
jgi:hypothetical protein